MIQEAFFPFIGYGSI